MKTLFNHIVTAALLLCLAPGCESDDGGNPTTGENPSAGVGGSMAQFTIQNGKLLTLDAGKVTVYELAASPAQPKRLAETTVTGDAETLFPYRGNIYMGSQSGMTIYNLEENGTLRYLSNYNHITACDPVVVQGNFAYLTIRNGTACRWGQNELQILDVGSEFNPFMVTSYRMYNPHGLAIRNNTLYVCNGSNGIELVDVSDKQQPQFLTRYTDFFAYDAIAMPTYLVVTGKDGIYQFGYEGESALNLLSKIPVQYAN